MTAISLTRESHMFKSYTNSPAVKRQSSSWDKQRLFENQNTVYYSVPILLIKALSSRPTIKFSDLFSPIFLMFFRRIYIYYTHKHASICNISSCNIFKNTSFFVTLYLLTQQSTLLKQNCVSNFFLKHMDSRNSELKTVEVLLLRSISVLIGFKNK